VHSERGETHAVHVECLREGWGEGEMGCSRCEVLRGLIGREQGVCIEGLEAGREGMGGRKEDG
jgi:hypothetical protein